MNPGSPDRALVWLTIALGASSVLSALIIIGLVASGEAFGPALRATAPGQLVALGWVSGEDSWTPMVMAYQRDALDGEGDLYAVMRISHRKFQYPPSSLLGFDLLPPALTVPENGRARMRLREILSWSSRVALVVTVLVSALILIVGIKRNAPGRRVAPDLLAACFLTSLLLGVTFYPLTQGYVLGQIQVYIDCLVALALLFHLLGRDALSGMCLGICGLVKPQFMVALVWAVLRGKRRFALAFAGILAVGLSVSVYRFGLDNHVNYLRFLKVLADHGEAYWANQSVNGLLNRLFENGSPSDFTGSSFPPVNRGVRAATWITSLALLFLAFWPGFRRARVPASPPDRGDDFVLAIAAFTMGSPVAWEHHYGVFLPIFAAALPGLLRTRPLGRATGILFAISYVAIANVMQRPRHYFWNPWFGLLASHLFFGSLLLFALLLALRAALSAPHRQTAAGTAPG